MVRAPTNTKLAVYSMVVLTALFLGLWALDIVSTAYAQTWPISYALPEKDP